MPAGNPLGYLMSGMGGFGPMMQKRPMGQMGQSFGPTQMPMQNFMQAQPQINPMLGGGGFGMNNSGPMNSPSRRRVGRLY